MKPLDAFYRAKDMKDGHRNDCIECNKKLRKNWYSKNREDVIQRTKQWQQQNRERHLATQRKRREENREALREKDRTRWLNAKYGLTPEGFDQLLAEQHGACAVCGRKMGQDLHVDHDHKTNEVRGLLCGSCNRGIGLLQENPTHLHQAGRYLTDFKLGQYERFLEPLTRPLDQIPVK
jgi:hypothetical protein